MAIFDTQPVIIESFSLLVIIPAVTTFVLMLVVRGLSQRSENPTLPFKEIHARRALQLLVGAPFAVMVLSVIVGLTFDTGAPYPLFILSQVVLDAVISALIGVLIGFLLAALYSGLGVSAFMLCTLLMFTVPLAAVSAGSTVPLINVALDLLDSLTVFALFFNPYVGRFMQRITTKTEPTQRSISQVISHMAGAYVLESVRVLRERAESDGDAVAREALELFLQTDGRTGDFIRETVKWKVPLPRSIDPPGATASKTKQSMPRGNWTLTNPRFRRRVKANRILFVILTLIMASLILNLYSALSSPLSQWGITLILPLLILSFPLALVDPLLLGSRLDVGGTLRVILAPLRGTESNLLVGAEADVPAGPDVVDTISPTAQEQPANVTLSSEFVEHQEPALQSFLKAVLDGKDDVYEEGRRPVYVIAVGGFVGFFGFLMMMTSLLTPSLPMTSILLVPMVVLTYVGVLVMAIGGSRWSSLTERTSFRGYRRSWLSVALSYLDAKESGIADVGMFMSVPRPPRQFGFLGFGGAGAVRGLLKRLDSTTSQALYSSIRREAMADELAPMKVLAVLAPVLLILALMMLFALPVMLPFAVVFAGLSLMVLCLYLYTWTKSRRVESESPTQADAGRPVTVAEVLRLLRDEYSYPLRLLTVRRHEGLVYTGRVYLTSTEVKFMEAVFVPSAPTA